MIYSNIRTRPVEVIFSTSNGSATALSSAPDYIDPGEVVLLIQPGATFIQTNVSLTNDRQPEEREIFYGYLRSLENVLDFSFRTTVIAITDIDSKYQELFLDNTIDRPLKCEIGTTLSQCNNNFITIFLVPNGSA